MTTTTRFLTALAFSAAIGFSVRHAASAQSSQVPIPAPSGVPAASPAPSPSPSPSASPRFYDRFAAVNLLVGSKVHNALAPGQIEPVTQSVRGAVEFRFFGRSFGELEYRRWAVTHPSGGYGVPNGTPCSAPGGTPPSVGNAGCVTQIGGQTSAYLNAARFTEQDVILNSSIIGIGRSINYLSTSVLIHSNNYGSPTLSGGFGIGAERLPDMRKKADLYGFFYYYPEVNGKYSLTDGSRVNLRYKVTLWRVGADLKIPNTPLFLEIGVIGDHYVNKQNAPGNATHSAGTLGFGGRF